jgi:Na+-driven multidrug efflux pump
MNNSNNPNHSDDVDKRVSEITGDPKKAIRSLSVPIIMSLLLMMSYNLADSIWVSGLGESII